MMHHVCFVDVGGGWRPSLTSSRCPTIRTRHHSTGRGQGSPGASSCLESAHLRCSWQHGPCGCTCEGASNVATVADLSRTIALDALENTVRTLAMYSFDDRGYRATRHCVCLFELQLVCKVPFMETENIFVFSQAVRPLCTRLQKRAAHVVIRSHALQVHTIHTSHQTQSRLPHSACAIFIFSPSVPHLAPVVRIEPWPCRLWGSSPAPTCQLQGAGSVVRCAGVFNPNIWHQRAANT